MAVYLALLTHVTCNKAEDKGHNDGKLYKMGMKLINESRISIYTPYEVTKKVSQVCYIYESSLKLLASCRYSVIHELRRVCACVFLRV